MTQPFSRTAQNRVPSFACFLRRVGTTNADTMRSYALALSCPHLNDAARINDNEEINSIASHPCKKRKDGPPATRTNRSC